MVRKFFTHLRQQWMGALALFFVLTGGTAYALDGSDTVFSDDIVNGEVRTADIRDANLTTADIRANAVTTGKIGDGEVTSGDVANDTTSGALTGTDVLNNSLTGGDIQNKSLGVGEFSSSIPAALTEHNSAQPIASGTGTDLNFDNEFYDTAGMHDNASFNSRLTAPVDGVYVINAGVAWEANATGRRDLSLKIGASQFATDRAVPATGVATLQEITTQALLVAGDIVEVTVFQNSGSELDILQVSDLPHFSMTWIAPGPE